ncbi:hypothetical protein ABIQ69_12080 [Agromyces sp. G08B096]|uniref:DUF11 domain-containing protein n=1 Tax=Agromyces sp. G08B096 TaxID=3156399 RepID=A0AAU7W4J6_9MICO
MSQRSMARRARRNSLSTRSAVRGGIAALTTAGLILLGLPTMAAAEEGIADPAATVAASPPAEPAPPPEEAPAEALPAEPAAEEAPPAPEPPEEAPAAEPEAPPVEHVPADAGTDAAAAEAEASVAPPAADAAQAAPLAGPPSTVPEWNDHVDICHATASDANPYVAISPSVRSIIDPNGDPSDPYSGGHAHALHQDLRDVIPAFDYLDAEGVQKHFPGLNLALLPILGEDCEAPAPTLQLGFVPCIAPNGELPALDVTLAGLLLAFQYEVRVYAGDTMTLVGSHTFTATGTGFQWQFDLPAPGAYLVVLHRVGDDPENDRTGTIVILPCPTPHWLLDKSSDPADGAEVSPGELITYTLHAVNDSDTVVTGAQAYDDLADVLDDATLVELGPGLTGPAGTVLTWNVPELDPGEEATTWYTVRVDADAGGTLLHNEVEPSPGGECPTEPAALVDEDPCVVDHPVMLVDVGLEKTATTADGGPVDSGEGDVITYSLTITNVGDDPAYRALVTDTLPEGVEYVEGSAVISPDPDAWGEVTVADGVLTVQHEGWLDPGDVVTITFDVTVGDLAQPAPDQPIPPLVNAACVAVEAYPPDDAPALAAVADDEPVGLDTNPANDCDEAETPVKSVGLVGMAQCVNDTPWFTFSITPFEVGDPAANPIVLIWWTPEAFAARDPSIPASDVAAILADGASQVDPIAYPAGWTSGMTISGQRLWPGAAVNEAGDPIAWPGWTQLADGTWVLDPSAPFYDLRDEAVVEIRVNPSNDAVAVYPPPTPNCNAAPDQPVRPVTPAAASPSRGGLAATGVDGTAVLASAALLLLLGAAGLRAGRRFREAR